MKKVRNDTYRPFSDNASVHCATIGFVFAHSSGT